MDKNIRLPDSIITDQLIQNNISDYDKQINEALYSSLLDIKNINSKNEEYEKFLMKEFEKESIERKNKFNEFILTMNRLIHFDSEIKKAYEIIKPIIELYCKQIVQYSELDKKAYEKVFNILSKKNINIKNIDLLKSIIKCD
jgi:hypothetical protein